MLAAFHQSCRLSWQCSYLIKSQISTRTHFLSHNSSHLLEEQAPPEMSMYKGPPLLDFEKRMISTPSQPQVDVEFSPYLKLLVGKVAASTLSNVTPLSLEASLLRINRILADKATLDAAVARDGHVPQSLPGYISSWHVMRFGQRDAARQHEIRLRARVLAFLGSYRRMTTCHDSTNETLDAFAIKMHVARWLLMPLSVKEVLAAYRFNRAVATRILDLKVPPNPSSLIPLAARSLITVPLEV